MLKMKAYRKSTFHKLYLIEPELYYKILPLLNELDKNELLQLNQKHSEEEMVIEEKNRDNMEKVESNSPSYQENQIMRNYDSVKDRTVEDRSSLLEENQIENTDVNSSPDYSIEEYPMKNRKLQLKTSHKQKRPKKYLCNKCTKAFTTKYSLKRHDMNFHTNQNKPYLQKEDPQNNDYIPPSNETNTYEINRGMKRKPEDTFDSQYKRMKPTRGIKRKQEDDIEIDTTDFKQPRLETSAMGLEDFSARRGIKRQMNRVSDSDPRKKTRWIDFY